jgi:murein DD-endopeptidase MepM/ murein hydrolase activator NlpD
MEKQAEQLKLNVTNIKSVLINSDKKLGKIRATNSALKRKELQQEKQEAAEKKIEMPRIPVVSQVFGTIKGVATSFLDKVLGFLGSILIGFVVTKLPEIMEGMKKVYDFVKPIWDGAVKTFSVIAGGFKFIYDNIASIFSPSEAKKELGAADDTLKGLDKEITSENLERELSETPGGDVEDDVDVPEPPSESPTPVTPTQTQTGGAPQLQPQPRNKGGEVTKTTQPNQQPHVRRGVSPNEMGKLNPFRMYPTIASSQSKMLKEHQKNADAFQKVFKDMKKGSFFGGGSPGGGYPSGGQGPKWTGGLVMEAGDFSGSVSVTSGFGMRGLAISPGMHMGVDIGGPEGTPLIAFTDGTVNATGYDGGYGNYVAWTDSFGTEHFYAHMRGQAMVSPGQQVKKGTKLGEMGNTGTSSGPHLHWEVANRAGDTGMSKSAILSRFDPLSKYPSTAPFGGASIKGGSGKGGGLGVVNNGSDYRVVYMPIEVEEIVRKPRPKSNPAVSMVNSSKQKKSFFPKVNPIHELI